jgi:membrane-associated phospholipid phosphatase
MDSIYQFGIQLIQALQALSPALDAPMSFFSFLGSIDFYLIFITLIFWVVDSQLGMRLLLVLVGTDFIGDAFKQLLHQPRPYWVGEVKALATETSYGLPSTHSSNSFSVWGTLAYKLRREWLWAVSGLVVVLIALSRLYLGVHFPQDVLGGWLIGIAVIYLFVQLEPKVISWLKRLPALAQIGTGFVVSLLIILTGLIINMLIASSPDPAEWAGFSIMARSPAKSFTLAGALFGAVAGYVFMLGGARFNTDGSPVQQVGRYFLGLAGVLVLYLGLDMLFSLLAMDESAAGYFLRYVRYASVTFWAMYGAPRAFLKLKLAEPAEKKLKPVAPA